MNYTLRAPNRYIRRAGIDAADGDEDEISGLDMSDAYDAQLVAIFFGGATSITVHPEAELSPDGTLRTRIGSVIVLNGTIVKGAFAIFKHAGGVIRPRVTDITTETVLSSDTDGVVEDPPGLDVLTDADADFVADGVVAGDFVRIGVVDYEISDVTTTTLTTTTDMPEDATTTYEVVRTGSVDLYLKTAYPFRF